MSAPPFHYCYHCGGSPLTPLSWRQFRCPSCGFSQFITPTPAAVGLVLDRQDRLLLMRRAHQPAFGRLGLPGGVIEPQESAEASCAREVAEETGIQLPATAYKYLGTACNRYPFQGFVWPTLDILFVARTDNFDAAEVIDGEASEITSVPLKDVVLEELAFETHAEGVRMLRTALGITPTS